MINKISRIVEETCKKKTNHFGYGIWTHHILIVVKYAKIMAKKIGADEEIVELAALLHDYASVKDLKLYEDHHINSAELAEKLLNEFNYPQNKIDQVKQCILCHRGSKVVEKLSKESLCVADADSMAHFASIPSLFFLAFSKHKMNINEANDWLIQKLRRSWNKLSPKAKKIMKGHYEASRLLLDNKT